jgi:hypothetical protein
MEDQAGIGFERPDAALNFTSGQTPADPTLPLAESQHPPLPVPSSSVLPETAAPPPIVSQFLEDNADDASSSSETTTSSESDSDETDLRPENALDSEDDVPPDVLQFGIRSKHEVQVRSFLISRFICFSPPSACPSHTLFPFRNSD